MIISGFLDQKIKKHSELIIILADYDYEIDRRIKLSFEVEKITNTRIVSKLKFRQEGEIWVCDLPPIPLTAAVADETLLAALHSGAINPDMIGEIECELLCMIMKIYTAKSKEEVENESQRSA